MFNKIDKVSVVPSIMANRQWLICIQQGKQLNKPYFGKSKRFLELP